MLVCSAARVFRRLVLLWQARQSRSCCPSSRVCLTCPERIGHARGIVHMLPAKITKLRRPSRPLIARMRATVSANSSNLALSRATH